MKKRILKQVQNDKTSKNKNKTLCHPEFSSGSHEKEILKQVQNDITSENKNKTLCHPEFSSGSHEKEDSETSSE